MTRRTTPLAILTVVLALSGCDDDDTETDVGRCVMYPDDAVRTLRRLTTYGDVATAESSPACAEVLVRRAGGAVTVEAGWGVDSPLALSVDGWRHQTWDGYGTGVVFTTDSGLHVVGLDGADPRTISADVPIVPAAWEPGTDRIAAVVAGSFGPEIRLYEAALRRPAVDAVEGVTRLAWTGDGDGFLAVLDGVVARLHEAGAFQTDVPVSLAPISSLDVSPDGEWIAVDVGTVARDVWIVRLEDAAAIQVTTDPADDHHPSWSYDGRELIFVSDRGGASDVWAIPVPDLEPPGDCADRREDDPVVTSVAPRAGLADSLVTLRGHAFGDAEGDAWTLTVDGDPVTAESWSDTLITFRRPVAPGAHDVGFAGDGSGCVVASVVTAEPQLDLAVTLPAITVAYERAVHDAGEVDGRVDVVTNLLCQAGAGRVDLTWDGARFSFEAAWTDDGVSGDAALFGHLTPDGLNVATLNYVEHLETLDAERVRITTTLTLRDVPLVASSGASLTFALDDADVAGRVRLQLEGRCVCDEPPWSCCDDLLAHPAVAPSIRVVLDDAVCAR